MPTALAVSSRGSLCSASLVPQPSAVASQPPRRKGEENCGKARRKTATSEDGRGKRGNLGFSYELEHSELSTRRQETAMKTIVSALIALSVLAGIAAPASAFDAKSFYEQQDRHSGGSAL